jgi:GNAT superfamily N-acetyltransferase
MGSAVGEEAVKSRIIPCMTLSIRSIMPIDHETWRPLWDGYCAFYQTTVPEDVTSQTWQRLLEPAGAVRGWIATLDGRAVGFVTCVLHASTWERDPICCLEDLFVDPNARGHGVGRALIRHVIDEAKSNGWPRVYWHTKHDNATARALYDRFAPADGFVRYVVRMT